MKIIITPKQLGEICKRGSHLEQQLYGEVVRLTNENEELQKRLRIASQEAQDHTNRLHILDKIKDKKTVEEFGVDAEEYLRGTGIFTDEELERAHRDIQDQTGWSNNLGDDCTVKPPTLDAETEELRERLRLSQANLIHWDVFVDKERVVKGTFVADDKPQLNIGTIKERLPTKETAEEFQRMRDAATPNLGDDCPIKPPTLEQAWQWHLEEANKKGFSTSSLTDITIPDWFRREYEEKYHT